MPQSFEKILSEKLPNQEKQSIKWFLGRLLYFQKKKAVPGGLKPASAENPGMFKPGEMYLYVYDAKYKSELPYWDAFPLILVLSTSGPNQSFLGLNLHYLPPQIRSQFFYKLSELAKIPLTENRLRIQFSYGLLKDSQRFAEYIPCIKKYLVSHVKSQMMRIYPHEWPMAVHLPLAKWKKASAQVVYQDSRKKIQKKRNSF